MIASFFRSVPPRPAGTQVALSALVLSFALTLLLLIASVFAQTSPPPGTWAQIPNTPALPGDARRSKSQGLAGPRASGIRSISSPIPAQTSPRSTECGAF